MGSFFSKNDVEIDHDIEIDRDVEIERDAEIEHDIEMERATKKRKIDDKRDFHRNVLMILSNGSHDMFKYYDKHIYINQSFVNCYGKLFEKDITCDYSNKNSRTPPEGTITIAYYSKDIYSHTNTREQQTDATFVHIKIHIKQKCIHDTNNNQYVVTGYDTFDGQYKIQHMFVDDVTNEMLPGYLNDNERKKYDGTINVATFTNLTKIIGYEPTSKSIIDAVNYVLSNDFIGKNQNVANVVHRMLNEKKSQLRSFITNNVNNVKK